VKRGNIVITSAPGDYCKPRPAVVIQSDLFNDTHASILVCLLTSDMIDAPLFRIDVAPDEHNGLQQASQIMVDKIMAIRRDRIREVIGQLDDTTIIALNRALALMTGIA
jgi:mRNA interferase MazF